MILMHLMDTKEQDTVFILPRHVTTQKKLRSSLTMRYMELQDQTSGKLFQLLSD